MKLFAVSLVSSAVFAVAAIFGSVSADAKSSAKSPIKTSYYPHWVMRDGNVTATTLRKLTPGSIIAVHHEWAVSDIRRILEAPGRFKISWYVEANVQERNDPAPRGMPVASRIGAARKKQDILAKEYPQDRFANLIELDGARDKYEGALHGVGNGRHDWVKDAAAAKAAGFRYVAKSPSRGHVKQLRASLGQDFVPRMVFEDITGSARDANPGYHDDAKVYADSGEAVTLVVHEKAYGGFAATSLDKARTIVKRDFNKPNVEAYWGRADAALEFVKIKDFGDQPEPVTAVEIPAAIRNDSE